MAHDYKKEIREWFAENADHTDIYQDSLFTALDADPDYWFRRAAFDKAVHEMIEAGEFDTYAGRLQFNPPALPDAETDDIIDWDAPITDADIAHIEELAAKYGDDPTPESEA